MALTYGFFSSQNGDRKYNARQFGSIFDGLIDDGVYSTIGDQFLVSSPENGFKVNVGTGRAWFLHTWTLNSSTLTVTVDKPEPLLDRWDAIVLEVDHRDSYRRNRIFAKKGTPANNPQKPVYPDDFEDTSELKQVPLAYVKVKANSDYIDNDDIDNRVGHRECPLVIGTLEQHMTADRLISDWRVQYDSWLDHNATAWWNWFENIQYVLDGDVAGHLQTQIDWIRKFSSIYYVDNVLYVPMSAASISGTKLIFAQDH